jgi:hypothetical protein
LEHSISQNLPKSTMDSEYMDKFICGGWLRSFPNSPIGREGDPLPQFSQVVQVRALLLPVLGVLYICDGSLQNRDLARLPQLHCAPQHLRVGIPFWGGSLIRSFLHSSSHCQHREELLDF